MFSASRMRSWLLAAAAALTVIACFAPSKASAITLSHTHINYGPVTANFTEVVVPVTITFDPGFFLQSISIVGSSDFSYLLGGGGTHCDIGSNASCNFGAAFTPTSVAFLNAKLTVEECDGIEICAGAELTLEGQGIARVSETPLPGTMALFATGLGFVGYAARRRRNRRLELSIEPLLAQRPVHGTGLLLFFRSGAI